MACRVFSEALKLLLFVGIVSALPTSKSDHSSQKRHVIEDVFNTQKRQGGLFAVLGVGGITGPESHPRLEIRELEKNEDQWNVYLLGLRRFQSVDQRDKLSYYQISGIHGRPYISWDSVSQGDGGSGGYCTHGSNIFPTWHRPYLALYEELLYLNARKAVSEFGNGELKDRYQNALLTLRMPYWDWAAVPPPGQSSLPHSIQRPTIDIVFPNGTNTVPNPLFSYTFHPLNQDNDFSGTPWTTWPSTLRNPSSKNEITASRNDLVALQLDSNRPNLQSRVYNVLSLQHDYDSISSDLQPGDSLESVHDTIHNSVGGGGHMSKLAYAAFDPIFWLHHANVDRIFAIWQALNPDSYVTSMSNPYATFTYKDGFTADSNTNLTPFHRDNYGNFWTSETTRSTSTFAYTYPELVGLTGNKISTLISRVNALYGPNATPQKRSTNGGLGTHSEMATRSIAGAPSFSGKRQYTANIKVRKLGMDASFNVYVFVGKKPGPSPQAWMSESSFVGSVGMLAQAGVADASKDFQEANGAVPLTAALEAKVSSGALENMREEAVGAYLKRHMRWRISKTDGQEVAVDNAGGFQISVLWAEIVPALTASEFPKVKGQYRVLVNATSGRPGGFRETGSYEWE